MKFHRAIALARYNWPLYVICFGFSLLGFAIAFLTSAAFPLRVTAFAVATVASWYAVASFVAFHLMFDRSDLLSGIWLRRCISAEPETCIQLSVCLEETTLPIEKVFPNARCKTFDLFDDSVMTEPAIARAKLAAKQVDSSEATPELIPVADCHADLTVVTLVAHEVRDPALRKRLFCELARITSTKGRVVVAEHLRNIPAALAFGPGLLHFYPRSEWLNLAKSAGLSVKSEFSITPFVQIFVLQHDECGPLNAEVKAVTGTERVTSAC